MKFYSIPNWREFQHYDPTKRTPPWIKSYIAQLDPTKHAKFAALSDGAKLTLHHVRMLAARCNNRIPETWLNKNHLNMHTKPKIAELIAACFLVDDKDASKFPSEGLDSESLGLPGGERERGAISRGQFLYLAGEVGKWRAETNHLYVGGDGEAQGKAFLKRFGMTQESYAELEARMSGVPA